MKRYAVSAYEIKERKEMIKNLRKNKKGFTLIEIIVVLVIMGILLAIAIPSILGYVGKANDAKYLAQARGGYLASQTITAEKASKATTRPTTAATITAAELNTELGLKSGDDGFITDGTCVTNVDQTKVVSCTLKVAGLTDKSAEFTPTGAKIVKDAVSGS